MGAISGPNSAMNRLLSNPEVKDKLLAATKQPDRTSAMADVASSLASDMGIPKENQTLTITEPTPQTRRRRGGGGTIMSSRGLIAGS